MIPELSRTHRRVELRFFGIRPQSVHRPNLRHVIPLFLSTIASFFLRFAIPRDNINVVSSAFCVGTERGKIANPIGSEVVFRFVQQLNEAAKIDA